jgi:hypothetical protein
MVPSGLWERASLGSGEAFGVNAPWPRPGEHEVKEDKAVEDRQIAAVLDRIYRTRRMANEIRERHFAGHDEGDQAGEEAEDEKGTADDLDEARIPDHRANGRWVRKGHGKRKQLDQAVLNEQQPGNDPQKAQGMRCPVRQSRVDPAHSELPFAFSTCNPDGMFVPHGPHSQRGWRIRRSLSFLCSAASLEYPGSSVDDLMEPLLIAIGVLSLADSGGGAHYGVVVDVVFVLGRGAGSKR